MGKRILLLAICLAGLGLAGCATETHSDAMEGMGPHPAIGCGCGHHEAAPGYQTQHGGGAHDTE